MASLHVCMLGFGLVMSRWLSLGMWVLLLDTT